MSLKWFILALSSVELTSILVHSHRLRITALLSAGCKATFESLPNIQSSSTTHNSGRATLLDGNHTRIVGKVQNICISSQFKVNLLFRTSCFTDSPIRSSQTQFLPDVSHKVPLSYPSTYYLVILENWSRLFYLLRCYYLATTANHPRVKYIKIVRNWVSVSISVVSISGVQYQWCQYQWCQYQWCQYQWYWLGRAWASPTLAGLHCKTCVYACGHIP